MTLVSVDNCEGFGWIRWYGLDYKVSIVVFNTSSARLRDAWSGVWAGFLPFLRLLVLLLVSI